MEILDGRAVALKIKKDLKSQIGDLGFSPRLEVILIGDDFASQKYVNMKAKYATSIGVECNINCFDKSADVSQVKELIIQFNNDSDVTGIMIQLPVQAKFEHLVSLISPQKDVDGLTEKSNYLPATARGIFELLDNYDINLESKDVLVIGRSSIVGLPVALEAIRRNSTVTVVHSKSKGWKKNLNSYDIVISSAGVEAIIKTSELKEGAVSIDVGINMSEDGKLVGDIEVDKYSDHLSYHSPVPGGVGPMTIACLMLNLVDAVKSNIK